MIRKATINDINTIVEYNANLARETESLELDIKRLKEGVNAVLSNENKGHYFLYEKDQQIIGQLMITTEWSDWRNGYFWWIQSVYVKKSHRRKGIFKALYQHVKEIVSNDSSICGLRLYVERENNNAQQTYKQLGMDETYYLLYEWEK